MKRDSFKFLAGKIRSHTVFQSSSHVKQAAVEHQLLVLLNYMGTSSSGANNPRQRNVFNIGRGTAQLCRARCVVAIQSLRKEHIKWPDELERKELSRRFAQKCNLPNCIAVADGTLFPLTYAPRSTDAPDYHGRKFPYSLSVMVVNDDNRRIRYYLSGFPGSTHDNRVHNNTKLAKNPVECFEGKCCLIADSAIQNSSSVVSTFKAPRGHELDELQSKFNTHVGRARVTSEHTIGLLKGCFPWLRSIPMIISNKKRSVRKILKHIDVCVILHNMLLDLKDEFPTEWNEETDQVDDRLTEALVTDQHAADERRQRLLEYLRDFVF